MGRVRGTAPERASNTKGNGIDLRFFASFIALVLLAFIPSPAVAEIDFGDLTILDQNFNIAGQDPVAEGKRGKLVVYQYDIPIEIVGRRNIAESRFLDPSTRNMVIIKKGDREYIRFFACDVEKVKFKEFDEKFREYRQAETLEGRLLQGNATIRLKQPGGDYLDIDIKMKPRSIGSMQSSIGASDAVQAALTMDGDRNPNLSRTYPEHFGAGVTKDGFTFTYSVRVRTQPKDGGVDVPTHGLLGNRDLMKRVAEQWRKGATPEQWLLQEFLPKLARSQAELQFRHGIFLPSHTQNTLVRIHPNTGEVLGFAGRDMGDVMMSGTMRDLAGKPMQTIMDLQNHWLTPQLFHSFQMGRETPGAHADQFIKQVITAYFYEEAEGTPEQRTEARKAYLRAYIKHVEEITGMKVPPSEAYQWGLRNGEMGIVLKHIFKTLVEMRLPRPYVPKSEADQARLAEVFLKRYKNGQTSYYHEGAVTDIDNALFNKSLRFGTDGTRIYAMDGEGKPLGFVFGLSDFDKGRIPRPPPCFAVSGAAAPSI